MWFLHAMMQCYTANHSRLAFQNLWLGRNSQELWPFRSPDIIPVDTCLWCTLKTKVYYTKVYTQEGVWGRVQRAVSETRTTPEAVPNLCVGQAK